MIRGLYQNAASMILLEEKTDVLANNMANVSTAGYKDRGVYFQQLITAEEALQRNLQQVRLPDGATPTYTDYTAGVLKQTGNPWDLAIRGDGFFAVQTPTGTAYTRSGQFTTNQEGVLVDASGYPVIGEGGPVTIPQGSQLDVDASGSISVDGTQVGRLAVFSFPLQEAVYLTGNYFRPAGGQVSASTDATVEQGYLEGSNVSVVREMVEMIQAHRHFEANQKLIQAQDGTLNKTVNDVGR